MSDPRPAVIARRLAGVGRVVAVTGWKGGIGKSVVSSTLALLMARRGLKVGLFDLDLTGSSSHVILGAGDLFPKEEKGILPPVVAGVRLMSAAFFAKDNAVPLRGAETSGAILELLAVTRWEELDFLVLDMPPGIGDTGLDVLRWIGRAELLVVTTPSVLAAEAASKAVRLFDRLGSKILGVIENLYRGEKAPPVGAPFLGAVEFDPGLEAALGDPEGLLKTAFARDLDRIVSSKILTPAAKP